jgi:cation diffusion facilitator family transporter
MAEAGWSKAEARQAKRLGVVLAITLAFVSLELTGAVIARSDVLLADGAHLLLDVFALGLSILAMRLAVRPPTARFTFGLRRIEPLAALGNGVLVVVVSLLILREAASDLHGASAPRPDIMLLVAAAALVVHGVSAWLIHDAIGHAGHEHHDHHGHGHGHALNLRGVWLHLVGDVLGAVTALIAAVVIRFGGSPHVDAGGSVIVALLLLAGAAKLLKDAIYVLLDAAPAHLPTDAVKSLVLALPGVAEVSQLKVWSLGAGHDAVLVRVKATGEVRGLAAKVREGIQHRLGVELCTVEVDEP